MKITNVFKLIIALVVCQAAGIIGALFTTPAIPEWYAGLSKPALNPPSWVFAPVWTILFVLMGVAAFLVWKRGLEQKEVKIALGVFIVQLVLNTLWSIIFFGLKDPGLAFIEIIILWLAILATIIFFGKISTAAAWLLVPYLLWVSFAVYLNFAIWQLWSNKPEPVACTMEAKLCPDGSYVGRTGPNCEFTACPKEESNNLWKIMTDKKTGITFSYPELLLTKYITTVDWPPSVNVSEGELECQAQDGTASLPFRTIKSTADGSEYCLETMSEGAAGSVYTTYTITTAVSGKLIALTFTLRYPQCSNYDDPQKTACELERKTFDLNAIADLMISSF